MKSQVKAALAGGAESTGVAKLQRFRADLSSSPKKKAMKLVHEMGVPLNHPL